MTETWDGSSTLYKRCGFLTIGRATTDCTEDTRHMTCDGLKGLFGKGTDVACPVETPPPPPPPPQYKLGSDTAPYDCPNGYVPIDMSVTDAKKVCSEAASALGKEHHSQDYMAKQVLAGCHLDLNSNLPETGKVVFNSDPSEADVATNSGLKAQRVCVLASTE